MRPAVLIIILNYGTYDLTLKMINELHSKLEYDNYSIIKYMKEYDVRKKLESNSKLCMLSDEKLKAAIEK